MTFVNDEEVDFTLYNQGLAEAERELCPLLRLATGRRAMAHLREVFTEDSVDFNVLYMQLQAHQTRRIR